MPEFKVRSYKWLRIFIICRVYPYFNARAIGHQYIPVYSITRMRMKFGTSFSVATQVG